MSVDRCTLSAKRFVKYVHSLHLGSCLIHEVSSVQLRWRDNYGKRLQTPDALIHTKCGSFRYTHNSLMHDQLEQGMILCRKCQGLGSTVTIKRNKLGPSGLTWKEAGHRIDVSTDRKPAGMIQ